MVQPRIRKFVQNFRNASESARKLSELYRIIQSTVNGLALYKQLRLASFKQFHHSTRLSFWGVQINAVSHLLLFAFVVLNSVAIDS